MGIKEFIDLWNEIAEFEEGEIRAWNSKSEILTEARTCERVKAYVKATERVLDT